MEYKISSNFIFITEEVSIIQEGIQFTGSMKIGED